MIDLGRRRNFPVPSWSRPIQLTEIPYHTGKNGAALAIVDGKLDAKHASGELALLSSRASRVTHTRRSGMALDITDGKLDATYAGGEPAWVEASIGQGSFAGEFGRLTLAEGGAFSAV